MSDIYTVILYGRKWAVKRPDGTLRCVVQAENLAKEIAKQCSFYLGRGGEQSNEICHSQNYERVCFKN